MLRDEVIERVTEPSPWVHPMQIAFKPDGRLRICMDPRYLNKYLEHAIFPFPSLDEVFSQVKGAQFFSKIDLTWGFWNLRLDEASSRLCTFVTPWGVFRYRRLPFGVSPAPEVFHRVIADVLEDLPGVVHYVDDVLVYGTTAAEHDQRLRVVLARLRRAGFAISDAKCVFRKPAVVFLGHLVSGDAIKPDPAKVAVLKDMKPPTNITEHRGLMGFVNFLAQYLPHFSTLTEPLRRLQSSKAHFKWTSDQQRAFDLLKDLFAREPCLAPFDQSVPVSLATDASATGLGAVLLQHGRPVMYVARSLTGAETRYSTIEKELLAVVFALRRCHFYTYGRPVRVLTDHRSLLGLMDADLEQMTPRLRRFVERLFPYDLTWEHIPGKDNYIPDYLSRMAPVPPAAADVSKALTFDAADARFTQLLLGGGPFYATMASVSYDDEVFAWLGRGVQHGWRRRCPAHIPGLTAYWPLRHRLRVSGPFLVLDDDRVCVPAALQSQALALLHHGHPGVAGMRAKARRILYWPGWSRQVAAYVQNCVPCAEQAATPPRPPYFWATPPEYPGDHVAADHFSFGNECYLVMLDVFSGFPFLYRCPSPSASALLQAAQAVFLQTGLPCVFLSDSGCAFVSEAFQSFLQACNVDHRCSSPQYAQSNGAAERAVRTLKTLRAKASSPFALFQAVLEMQNTPRGPCQLSPADVFLGRAQRTWSNPCPRPSTCSWAGLHRALLARQRHVDVSRPRRGVETVLRPGTPALLKDFFGRTVRVLIVGMGTAPRAYQVQLPSGRVTERNRVFLFPLPRNPSAVPSSIPMTPTASLPSTSPPTMTRMGLPPPAMWGPLARSSAPPPGTAFTSRRTCAVTRTATSSAIPPGAGSAPLASNSQTPTPRPAVMPPLPTVPQVPVPTVPLQVPLPGMPPVRLARGAAPPGRACAAASSGNAGPPARDKRQIRLTHRATESTLQATYRLHAIFQDRLPPPSSRRPSPPQPPSPGRRPSPLSLLTTMPSTASPPTMTPPCTSMTVTPSCTSMTSSLTSTPGPRPSP